MIENRDKFINPLLHILYQYCILSVGVYLTLHLLMRKYFTDNCWGLPGDGAVRDYWKFQGEYSNHNRIGTTRIIFLQYFASVSKTIINCSTCVKDSISFEQYKASLTRLTIRKWSYNLRI